MNPWSQLTLTRRGPPASGVRYQTPFKDVPIRPTPRNVLSCRVEGGTLARLCRCRGADEATVGGALPWCCVVSL
jgi:hypothetical protein